jgi:hypothetical protein
MTLASLAARAALSLTLLAFASTARAQQVTPEQGAAALQELERLIRERYVVAEKREPLAAMLRAGRASGRYSLTDGRALALRVTEDLHALSKDGHLDLRWDPADHAQLVAAEAARKQGQQSANAHDEEQARLHNHGLEELRILDGNIRYLRLSSFHWRPDTTGAAYDAAMRFLRDGDAVVIDIRGNGGGSTSAVRYAISHFFPGEPERLLMTFTDDEGRPDQSRVLGYLPAGRVTRGPLYVLTDYGTFSAGEEFAYHVKQFKLGTLVGEKTGGGANNNALFPLAPGFVASISYFSPKHGVTGGNWDGTGVEPDIATAPRDALAAAQAHALEALVAKAEGAARARYSWALAAARAAWRPVTLKPTELARYAGRYGERTVTVEGGGLVFQRDGRPPVRLTPLGDDLFAFEGMTGVRVRFKPEGRAATALELLYADGGSASHPRTR